MALFDWNMDGKKDWQDDFLEFNIFKECMEEVTDEDTFDSDDDFDEDLDGDIL